MRITSELVDTEFQYWPPGPYWVPENKRVSPKDFLTRLILADHKEMKIEEISDELYQKYNTKPNRVRWMLDDTMGSAMEFERRKQELEIITGKPSSDDDVVHSFIESVKEGGWMREYIRLGQLGLVLDETLFVHGGIMGNYDTPDLISILGLVPGLKEPIHSVHEWVESLNVWKNAQFQEWEAHPLWDENHKFRGGMAAIDYVVPGPTRSVVMGRHLNAKSHAVPLFPEVEKELLASGIQRVIVGHTPHGNCPTVVKPKGSGVELIMADTSYSDMKTPDNRGLAASFITIQADNLHVHGLIEDGTLIDYHLSLSGGGDQFIGRETADGRWVKAKFVKPDGEGHEYLLCAVDCFKYIYSRSSQSELAKLDYKHENNVQGKL